MYLRTTKVKRSDGRVDEYIRLVESYWNNGSPRHRIVCNLGRKEVLAPHAEALLQLLKGESQPKLKIKAAALGFESKTGSCGSGMPRWIDWWPTKNRSRRNCFCGFAICLR